MSSLWVIRLGLVAVLFALVALSFTLLGDRRKYATILESTPLEILYVLIYNACCYLSVGIPADPGVIRSPPVLRGSAVACGLQGVGIVLLLMGIAIFSATALKRRVIGGQDTRQGLITSGVYRFCRHPIYLGIVLVSSAIPLVAGNLDGMIVVPLVFLANALQAAIEEKCDVGVRFEEEYRAYRETTWMFGPPWCWLVLSAALALVLAVGPSWD